VTPAARAQAAIEILDRVLDGQPAEQVLTGWARRSRYAGSKDRAAVRDLVFDGVRCMRSHAALGGARSGRGLILGAMREANQDPDTVFNGQPYAPAPLSEEERRFVPVPGAPAEQMDLPDWLWPLFLDSLGGEAEPAALALRSRAPVHLRVNTDRIDRDAAVDQLAREGVSTRPHRSVATALEVIDGARRVRQSDSYLSGAVELQDASSQAVVAGLPLCDGMRILDYCAGGGGKALAMAARARVQVFAHDAAPERMKDVPVRAARAGVRLDLVPTGKLQDLAPFDLVLCDVPCSGSGAWRRAPEGKWRLRPDGLAALNEIQDNILDQAAGLVAGTGTLAYATCSVLLQENDARVSAFLATHPGWRLTKSTQWSISQAGDGFFCALLTRA
jgi:16S rRNA (cytosine967-C5)-methyltransferase